MPSNPDCPNVLVTSEEERELHKRYQQAKSLADRQAIQDFEDTVREKSSIVINMEIKVLYHLAREKQYQTRYQLPKKIVEPKREKIDEHFFGNCGREIRYAALSLDGWGLAGWGICTICLREERMQDRVSLFEENSYRFWDKFPYSIQTHGNIYPPPGYRTSWQKRHELAVAKLYEDIKQGMQQADFARLIMNCGAAKMDDDFIEVYICGGFTQDVIQYAGLMRKLTPEDCVKDDGNSKEDCDLQLMVIKDKLGERWKGMKQ